MISGTAALRRSKVLAVRMRARILRVWLVSKKNWGASPQSAVSAACRNGLERRRLRRSNPQAVPRSCYSGSRAGNSLQVRGQFSSFIPFCTPGREPIRSPPGLQMLQTGIVGERLAAGINWVDRQIGGGDFVAGQILRLGKLLVGKAPQIDEAVFVELDRRIRHLFRHAGAEEEDVLIGRGVVGGAFGHPLEHPYPG